jgi:hypothetical protein
VWNAVFKTVFGQAALVEQNGDGCCHSIGDEASGSLNSTGVGEERVEG